jgi:hypothetical protein
MRIPYHPTYILRLLPQRLKQRTTTSPVRAAAFGQDTHRCGRPTCRCHHGGPRHTWRCHAIECVATAADGTVTRFAWSTNLFVSARTVETIAWTGGRYRGKIANDGCTRQPNSGVNLEHVSSTDPEKGTAYYYLVQIAFIIIHLLERGRLLRRWAVPQGGPVLQGFGSLKNIGRRLLESLRHVVWPEASSDAPAAARVPIGLATSSAARPEAFSRVADG